MPARFNRTERTSFAAGISRRRPAPRSAALTKRFKGRLGGLTSVAPASVSFAELVSVNEPAATTQVSR
jgi:hypothetical protein